MTTNSSKRLPKALKTWKRHVGSVFSSAEITIREGEAVPTSSLKLFKEASMEILINLHTIHIRVRLHDDGLEKADSFKKADFLLTDGTISILEEYEEVRLRDNSEEVLYAMGATVLKVLEYHEYAICGVLQNPRKSWIWDTVPIERSPNEQHMARERCGLLANQITLVDCVEKYHSPPYACAALELPQVALHVFGYRSKLGYYNDIKDEGDRNLALRAKGGDGVAALRLLRYRNDQGSEYEGFDVIRPSRWRESED